MAESCPFAPAVAFDDYENPVRTCLRYLVCPTGRAARAAVGRAIMQGRSATEYIAAAVAARRPGIGRDLTACVNPWLTKAGSSTTS
ncbi:hypothetical protein [Nocardia grenadensis]|uniref:hypothetical protein n=1 Tax=Nocardia grenadensis TaxID=931537 RepID=UPI0007A4E4BA|nr:hypothetical protein [Nocardia grenadensis]